MAGSSREFVHLGATSALADGDCAAFTIATGRAPCELFVVRRGANYYAYVNSCPHTGAPLDWVPGRFLDAERRWIQCATHYALFEIESGVCVHGPCRGQGLRRLQLRVAHGELYAGAELT